ncbi:hypothetical protein NXW75_11015 [Bacteroides xylanisolvens]|nr:hypothetical protein [Bacteroides xylanisolvens]
MWIDGREVGKCNYLSTPQEFNLTHFLAPGSHKLTIRVDNGKSIPGQICSSSHACTESTQTKLERYYRTDGIAGNESIVY